MAYKKKTTKTNSGIAAVDMHPAIYLRVSTQEQADSGLGLAAQQARCLAMADAKGWPIPVIYADEGVSGTRGREKRPRLDLLMQAVEAGTINAVIVLDLTRLARRTQPVLSLIDTRSMVVP